MDAINLLKADHREVEALFEDFEKAKGVEAQQIAQSICEKLTVHTQIEEELLYPAAHEAMETDDDDMVYEAEVEHTGAKFMISQIEESDSSDPQFEAKVMVLSEYIKHHVKEEEKELFVALKETEVDLDDLGEKLEARKMELMDGGTETAAPKKRASR